MRLARAQLRCLCLFCLSEEATWDAAECGFGDCWVCFGRPEAFAEYAFWALLKWRPTTCSREVTTASFRVGLCVGESDYRVVWRQICEADRVWESGMSVYVLHVHLPTCVFVFGMGYERWITGKAHQAQAETTMDWGGPFYTSQPISSLHITLHRVWLWSCCKSSLKNSYRHMITSNRKSYFAIFCLLVVLVSIFIVFECLTHLNVIWSQSLCSILIVESSRGIEMVVSYPFAPCA